jgi:pentatricopeptide repeat protein
MIAGYFFVRRSIKQRGQPASYSSHKEASPSKQKSGDCRFGFQRGSPEVHEACVLLQQGKVKAAVSLLQKQPDTMAGAVPHTAARSVLITAMRMSKKDDVTKDLMPLKGKLPAGALEGLILGAAKKKDVAECRQLDGLSSSLQIPKSQPTLEALAQAYSFDANALRGLVEEASTPLAKPFAEIVLQACSFMKDYELAADVMKKVDTSDSAHLRRVVGKETSGTGALPVSPIPTSVGSDMSMSEASSPRSSSDDSEQSNASRKDLDHMSSTSAALDELDACVKAQDVEAAEKHFNQAKQKGTADTACYHAMMKAYLSQGNEASAKSLLAELTSKNLATSVSYHGLLNARVKARDQRGAWRLVTEMQVNGISPNAVTCSILLKGNSDSVEQVSRVLLLVDATKEPMDDVFFMALAEASIRVGRLDFLSQHFEKLQRQGLSGRLSTQTYGAMIKAYGQAHDMKKVWSLWNNMLSHKVALTSITLGCMVEALVANGLSTDAWKMVQGLQEDASVRPLVNAVIYTTILKGFASAAHTEKAMKVYAEMKAHGIEPNLITFNSLLNAFAQSGAMQHVPALWEDMKAAGVEPSIVTYSTLVKGLCNAGSLDRALQVFRDMRTANKCTADEAIYNCLLGGCAKEMRPSEALDLIADMRSSKVTPSNYTMNVVVKLLGRSRRLDEALAMVEAVSKEYNLKINIQVYTSLIQGCLHNGQAGKAFALYEKIIGEGAVLPDAMMYTILVRGCLRLGNLDKAIEFVKYAHGIGRNGAPGLSAGCLNEILAALGGAESEQASALLMELNTA